jgi:hypothetical protein
VAWLDALTQRVAARYGQIVDAAEARGIGSDAVAKRLKNRFDLFGLGRTVLQLANTNRLHGDRLLMATVECLWDPDAPCAESAAAALRHLSAMYRK